MKINHNRNTTLEQSATNHLEPKHALPTLSQILLRFINILGYSVEDVKLIIVSSQETYESRINTEMNQSCEPDSKANTETLEQTKSTSHPRRARPKTKHQVPTNLSEQSFSLKPELTASNRRGKHNSDQANHQSGSLSHKTSYICSIHNK